MHPLDGGVGTVHAASSLSDWSRQQPVDPDAVLVIGEKSHQLLLCEAESRVRVVRTYIGKVGTELCCETILEKCTIG